MRATPTTDSPPGVSPALPPVGPTLFVGREEELARSLQAAERLRLLIFQGLPGVGKTTVMMRVATRIAEQTTGSVAYCRCHPDLDNEELLRTVAQATDRDHLLASSHPPARTPLDALVGISRQQPIVLCLDHAHHLAKCSVLRLVADLAGRQLPAWVLMASRIALPVSLAETDHQVVHLAGLRPEEVAELWSELELLRGTRQSMADCLPGFLAASPRQVRELFTGPGVERAPDPMGLQDLPRLAQELLVEVCAYRVPVPADELRRHRNKVAVDRALACLAQRFLVSIDEQHRVAPDDVVRTQGCAALGFDPRAAHARCLELHQRRWRERPGDMHLELEVLYHAVASGHDDLAERIIHDYAEGLRLVPAGAPAERELLAAVRQLASRRELSRQARRLQLRLSSREGDPQRASAATSRLAAEPLDELTRGEIALLAGRLEEAVVLLQDAARSEPASSATRVMAQAALIECLRAQGHPDAAADLAQGARPIFQEAGGCGEALLAWLTAVCRYEAEDYAGAAHALDNVCQWQQGEASAALVPPIMAVLQEAIEVGAGHRRHAHGAVCLHHEALYFRLVGQLYRAETLLREGHAQHAVALTREASEEALSNGYHGLVTRAYCLQADGARLLGDARTAGQALALAGGATGDPSQAPSSVRAMTAVTLLVEGAVTEALSTATHALTGDHINPGTTRQLRIVRAVAAAACGARVALGETPSARGFPWAEEELAQVELLLWHDELEPARQRAQELEERAREAGWRWIACHAELACAEALARLARFDAATSACEEAYQEARQQGYLPEVLRSQLLRAMLARGRGENIMATRLLGDVARTAKERGLAMEAAAARAGLARLRGRPLRMASPGSRLAARLGLTQPLTHVLREAHLTCRLTEDQSLALDRTRYALFLDLEHGLTVVHGRPVSLRRRRALLSVLQTLAREPGATVPTPELVAEVWGEEYTPSQHRSRITVAVTRLRQLLGTEVIGLAPGGYRLDLPTRWAILTPRTSRPVTTAAAMAD